MVTAAQNLPAVRACGARNIVTALIPTRAIGGSGLKVTELGLGAAPIGNLYQPISDSDAADTASAALAAGIRYFDTAPYYGFGLSERRIGDVLRGVESVLVSSKVGRLLKADSSVQGYGQRHGYCSPMPFEPMYDYSFDGVMISWESSLQRLGLARIDILYVHDIGRSTHGDRHEITFRELTDGGGFRALEQLRAAGAIQAFGLGVNETAVCLEAMAHTHLDVILLAGRYTLLEQGALDSLLPACSQAGTSIVVGGPYSSWVLATGTQHDGTLRYDYGIAPQPIVERVRRIETVCERHGVPLAAAALQFPLAHPQVASVIPGLASRQQIEATLSLYGATIPGLFWQEMKSMGLLHGDAPVPAYAGNT
jgi:D-threo-aldose 1-dehydrogenase